MKKRIFSLAFTLAMLLAFVPAAIPASATAFTSITGKDMIQNIMLGTNIGNTLESRNWDDKGSGLEAETLWGEAKIQPWHFKAIKQKGFTAVRIPVTWETHMDKDYIIDKAWMDRVQECVDMALAEGLYVVLNAHHEYLVLYKNIENGNMDVATKFLTSAWTQIADRFKGYSEKLIFEPMNEPHMENGWVWINGKVDTVLCDRVNTLNLAALDVIRKSGGRNAQRVVALTVPGAQADCIEYYEKPDDPYTMLGVFYYPGHDFKFIEAMDKSIPFFIKEIAPLMEMGPGLKESETDWTKRVFGDLAKMDIPTFFWNTGALLFDSHTGEWNKPLINAIFTAYGKTPGGDYQAPPLFPVELEGPYTGDFNFWASAVFARAEKMVVEYKGTFNSGYAFARFTSEWAQFDTGHARIAEEAGRLTFDMRGLEGQTVGFAAWDEGDAAKITRIYLDTWTGSESQNLLTADNWAREHITEAIDNGWLPAGLQDNYKQAINRKEFVYLAMSWLRYHTGMADAELVQNYAAFPDRTFSDTADPVILAAGKLDITAGSDGRFNLMGNFNRQDAAVMLVKVHSILNQTGGGFNTANPPAHGWTDLDAASSYARSAINFMGVYSVMSGSGGKFNPRETFSRQHSITVFNNIDRRENK